MLTEDGSQRLERQEKLWYNELFSTFKLIFISFIAGKLNAPLSTIFGSLIFTSKTFYLINFYFRFINQKIELNWRIMYRV